MPFPTKKRYLMRFAVSGNGAFPMDMLRQDRCFPDKEEDSVKLSGCETRTVSLCAHVTNSADYPSATKWQKNGWRVGSNVRHYKL